MNARQRIRSGTSTNTLRVLLAEDDLELRRLIARALRRDGYQVVEAPDGTELLELVADTIIGEKPARPYDLILTDIRMPGWSGMEILHGLYGRGYHTPVVLITAFGDEETHRLAQKLGAVCVLDKPFELDDLRMVVLNTINRRGGAAPRKQTQ
jgi:DNA-binding response OmpR family regulator